MKWERGSPFIEKAEAWKDSKLIIFDLRSVK